jgi:hypothetical protein
MVLTHYYQRVNFEYQQPLFTLPVRRTISLTSRRDALSTHSTDGLLMSQPFSFIMNAELTRCNHIKRKRYDARRPYFHSFTRKEEKYRIGTHSQRQKINFYDQHQRYKEYETFTSLGMVRRRRSHNNNNNDDNEYSMGQQFYNSLFTSSKSSAIFYQLILSIFVVVKGILPRATAVIAVVLYMVFSGVSQTLFVVDEQAYEDESDSAEEYEDNDPRPVYLLAFIGALLTAGIVTPLNIPSGTAAGDVMRNSPFVLPFVSFGLVAALLFQFQQSFSSTLQEKILDNNNDEPHNDFLSVSDAITNDRKLMEIWDEDFRKTCEMNDTNGDD